MLSDDELMLLIQQLCATAEVLGQEIKPTTAAMMAEDLAKYPLEVVGRALARLRSNSDGRLTLKAIVDVIEEGSGRLTANEAWALALGAMDESATVVWTPEIAEAWAVARPVMDAGDKIGARMAFIPAYERLVKEAREAGRPVEWKASLGWDEAQRVQVLSKAVESGKLPARQEAAAWPLRTEPVDPAGRERVHKLLRKLSDDLKANSAQNEARMLEIQEREREAFEARKAEVVKQALGQS